MNARAIVERHTADRSELLLQIRSRAGEPRRWELPGGQIDPFESVLDALAREIAEETGLELRLVTEAESRETHHTSETSVETFEPFFAYQTLRGPVDSLGFYFRCRVDGEPLQNGDDASEPTWIDVEELKVRFESEPEEFDWLTRAALERYLEVIAGESG